MPRTPEHHAPDKSDASRGTMKARDVIKEFHRSPTPGIEPDSGLGKTHPRFGNDPPRLPGELNEALAA